MKRLRMLLPLVVVLNAWACAGSTFSGAPGTAGETSTPGPTDSDRPGDDPQDADAGSAEVIAAADQASGETAAERPVLPRIRSYEAPTFPAMPASWTGSPDDYARLAGDSELKMEKRRGFSQEKPELALVCDLVYQAVVFGSASCAGDCAVSREQLRYGIEQVTIRQWYGIASPREWTHWNFLVCLSSDEQDMLANEAAAFWQSAFVGDYEALCRYGTPVSGARRSDPVNAPNRYGFPDGVKACH